MEVQLQWCPLRLKGVTLILLPIASIIMIQILSLILMDFCIIGMLFNKGNLCPVGWHVPDDNEWIDLINYLECIDKAGGKLKESGYLHWITPNTRAVDEYGFSALPAGWRSNRK